MPFNSDVPHYTREDSTHAKELSGGAFRAFVPNTLTVQAAGNDSDPFDYVVRLGVDVIDGRLVCTRCEVEALEGGPAVTAEALRRVAVGRYLREGAAHTGLVGVGEPIHGTDGHVFIHPVELPPSDYAAGGMSDEVLYQTVRIYKYAMAIGDAPLGMLEREYGVPRAKGSRWITTARRRGLLVGADDER